MNVTECRLLPFLMLVSFCFFSNPHRTAAQTVHLVIAADMKAADIGTIAKIDQWNVEQTFLSNIPSERLAIVRIPEEKMGKEGVCDIIADLTVTEEDALVFYYTGRGSFDTRKQEQFFDLPRGALCRSDLMKRLREKSPRLIVLLTDCCNIPASKWAVPRIEAPNRPLPKARSISPLFESLFMNARGTVDITSSTQGQFSLCDTRESGNRGSCFTYPMVDLIHKNKDNFEMTWKRFVDKLSPAVDKAFRENYPEGFEDQTTQTVAAFEYPGMKKEPNGTIPTEKYRFGTRVIKRSGGGFLVLEVFADSPARRSGLEVGDVILEINDKSLDTEEEYSDAVDASGQKMKLKLIDVRSRKTIVRTILLGW